jgi:hypothetical protein
MLHVLSIEKQGAETSVTYLLSVIDANQTQPNILKGVKQYLAVPFIASIQTKMGRNIFSLCA